MAEDVWHSRPSLARWETEWLKPYAINPRLESYAYESAEDHPENIRLINKAYQFANDVCATINEYWKASFLGQNFPVICLESCLWSRWIIKTRQFIAGLERFKFTEITFLVISLKLKTNFFALKATWTSIFYKVSWLGGGCPQAWGEAHFVYKKVSRNAN